MARTTFGADDRKAARMLSIGNTPELETTSDPYKLAVLCKVAIESLVAPIRESETLDSRQIAAFDRIVGFYTNRTAQLGAALGKSRSDIASDVETRRAADTDRSERGRAAVGCISRLQ